MIRTRIGAWRKWNTIDASNLVEEDLLVQTSTGEECQKLLYWGTTSGVLIGYEKIEICDTKGTTKEETRYWNGNCLCIMYLARGQIFSLYLDIVSLSFITGICYNEHTKFQIPDSCLNTFAWWTWDQKICRYLLTHITSLRDALGKFRECFGSTPDSRNSLRASPARENLEATPEEYPFETMCVRSQRVHADILVLVYDSSEYRRVYSLLTALEPRPW